MENILKNIFTISIAVIFVVSSLVTLFGVGEFGRSILREYVFPVDSCVTEPTPKGDVERCGYDKESNKRDMADGLAMGIVGGLATFLTFREIKKKV